MPGKSEHGLHPIFFVFSDNKSKKLIANLLKLTIKLNPGYCIIFDLFACHFLPHIKDTNVVNKD